MPILLVFRTPTMHAIRSADLLRPYLSILLNVDMFIRTLHADFIVWNFNAVGLGQPNHRSWTLLHT